MRLSASCGASDVGHQLEGIAPLGKKRNAVRKGAPEAVVAKFFRRARVAATAPTGRNDSKAGRAIQVPTPRKKCRLEKPECAAECEDLDSEDGDEFMECVEWQLFGRKGKSQHDGS